MVLNEQTELTPTLSLPLLHVNVFFIYPCILMWVLIEYNFFFDFPLGLKALKKVRFSF